MHETSARTWCSGRTWRERVGREVGGGIEMGKTCEPKAFSFQCMTKFTTKKIKNKKLKKLKKKKRVLHSICQQIWKTQQWPQDWKESIFIPIPKKDNAKECSNHHTIALISHASKVMLKILQARLNSTWTVNFQVLKLDLEKAEEPEIKLPTSAGSSKMQESSRKTSTSALLTTPKPLTVWITQTLENSSKDGKTRSPYLPPEKSVCRSRSNR